MLFFRLNPFFELFNWIFITVFVPYFLNKTKDLTVFKNKRFLFFEIKLLNIKNIRSKIIKIAQIPKYRRAKKAKIKDLY